MNDGLRPTRLLEAGASVIFYGLLAQQPDLRSVADQAIRELTARGFGLGATIRVYPHSASHPASSIPLQPHLAGAWNPGVIILRDDPTGNISRAMYLRHELFHEASFQTCRGRLPRWAEEAGAIAFSGESLPTNEHDRKLALAVQRYGWPDEPCAQNPRVGQELSLAEGTSDAAIVTSVLSGRALLEEGAVRRAAPPGSVLKLIYAGALRKDDGRLIHELVRSDSDALGARIADLDCNRLATLYRSGNPAAAHIAEKECVARNSRVLLGERDSSGVYPITLSPKELSQILRRLFLEAPARFRDLVRIVHDGEGTLKNISAFDRQLLTTLRPIMKTGSAATPGGAPTVGHVILAWPAENPVYLAVLRANAKFGADTVSHYRGLLIQLSKFWSVLHRSRVTVRVQMLAQFAADDIRINALCERFLLSDNRLGSDCGDLELNGSGLRSLGKRTVSGILTPLERGVLLETDPLSYADGVLATEAAQLRHEGARALRAAVLWNALNGRAPHPDQNAVCDLTHCMVFRGTLPGEGPALPSPVFDAELFDELDRCAAKSGLNWLPFSAGGVEPWTRTISPEQLASQPVLDLQRIRDRSGRVSFRVTTSDDEFSVSCDLFLSRLKLPSCPEAIQPSPDGLGWVASGFGRGHGQGLSVAEIEVATKAGLSAREILKNAYCRE